MGDGSKGVGIESLRASLNPVLAIHGARIDERGRLQFESGRTADNMVGIGGCLLGVSTELTAVMNMSTGKWWAEMDCGLYGDRMKLLRSIVHPSAVDGVARRLMNYASIYRRWLVVQGNHSWSWHRTHKPGVPGRSTKRCVTSSAERQRFIDAGLRFLNTGELGDLEKLRAAAAPFSGEIDDDSDDFE